MDEHVLHLTDGSTVSAKVNFATLYYIEKNGIADIIKKYQKDDENAEESDMSEADSLEVAARMIHVLLLSNGRNVTFAEALTLCPLDTDEVMDVFKDFQAKLEDYKKKQDSKRQTAEFLKTK